MTLLRLNVLVYSGQTSGPGATTECVRHALHTLRALLMPSYAVAPISELALLREPWPATCALLVIPGGSDSLYCNSLHGDGVARITSFVRAGGAYLGLCAGGYFGSARCEFDSGPGPGPGRRIIGSRELAFFPGTCRGPTFAGFEYHSERGARAAGLNIGPDPAALHAGDTAVDQTVRQFAGPATYWNGGGVFVGADRLGSRGVEVLARYTDRMDLGPDPDIGNAAIVYCKVGRGGAVLTGSHPECGECMLNAEDARFSAAEIRAQPAVPGYDSLLAKLAADDAGRVQLMDTCLRHLRLEVNEAPAAVPEPTPLHLSSLQHTEAAELVFSLTHGDSEAPSLLSREDSGTIQGGENLFVLSEPKQPLRKSRHGFATPATSSDDANDKSPFVFNLVVHEAGWPDQADTPFFRHDLYYQQISAFHRLEPESAGWGRTLLYGEVVTSTNTILEKILYGWAVVTNRPRNPNILARLPTGFAFIAKVQIAGRGRGNNVWLTPAGSLCLTVVINYPAHLASAPSRAVVFMQYLAAVAVVEAVRGYDAGLYERLPIKLKWPNDIYALDPKSGPDSPTYTKIGGILSNCTCTDGSFQILLGIGINAKNASPTVSLDSLLSAAAAAAGPDAGPGPAPICIERLAARLLVGLGSLYARFRREGFTGDLERTYYSHWLHSRQVVTLEAEGGVRARVLGLTPDWGMLRVEQLDNEGHAGREWTLQSDENSFDFWRGLVRRKT